MATDSSQNSQSYYTNSTNSGSTLRREAEVEEEIKPGSQDQSSSIQGTYTNISDKPAGTGRKRKKPTSSEDTKDEQETIQKKRSVNTKTSHNVDTASYGHGWKTGEDHYFVLDANHAFSSGDNSMYIKEKSVRSENRRY